MPITAASSSARDVINRDLACPQCRFNLRGLRGLIVTCPECGTECDVLDLASRRWQGKWSRAPGLWRIRLPAAWSFVLPLLLPISLGLCELARSAGAVHLSYAAVSSVAMLLWLLVAVGLWRGAYFAWGGWYGLWLVLLAHLTAGVFCFSVVIGLYGFRWSLHLWTPGQPLSMPAMAVIVGTIPASAIVFWAGHRLDKWSALKWIHRKLDASQPDS